MKCPKCGKEIADGNLLCEFCGAEVTIVPVYEPGVEEKIANTMSEISHSLSRQEEQEAARKKRQELMRRSRRRAFLILAGMGVGTLLACVIFYYAFRQLSRTESFRVGRAYTLAERGEFAEAADILTKLLDEDPASDESLKLLRAEYLGKSANDEGLEAAVEEILTDPASSEQEQQRAYEILFSRYEEKGAFASIATILMQCGDPVLRSRYRDYLAEPPSFASPSGQYEDHLHLEIVPANSETVYYRLMEAETGDAGSEFVQYTGPVSIECGEYRIAACGRNRFGVNSPEVEAEYLIVPSIPDPPELLTTPGSYREPRPIELKMPENGRIFYTTDGSDPTEESMLYSGPVTMPRGVSSFRFAVIGDNGQRSEIIEASYSLFRENTISAADGQNYILVALIRAGEVIDTIGTIRDGSARESFNYTGTVQVPGQGSLYVYEEGLSDQEGNRVQTGRRFAVNTVSGQTYLYDEPSAGYYSLIPIG